MTRFNLNDVVTSTHTMGTVGKVVSNSDVGHPIGVQWLAPSGPVASEDQYSLRRLVTEQVREPSMTMEEIKTNLITMIEEDWLGYDYAERVFDLFGLDIPLKMVTVSYVVEVTAMVPVFEADAVEQDLLGITVEASHNGYPDVEFDVQGVSLL